MSLTYGYDLKDGDKMLEAPAQASKILSPLVVPGGALVNHLPFRKLSNFPAMVVAPHRYFSAVHTFMGATPQLRTSSANN
jgi:hypothetical protein